MSSLIPSKTFGNIICHSDEQFAFLLSQAKVTVAIAGIRGGKTHVGALKTILYSLSHSCNEDQVHLVCSPTYPMSKVPINKIFRILYDKTIFPICPLIRYAKSERTFYLAAMDGKITKIMVASMHDPNKVRGIEALSAWLDEGAYMTEEAWEIIQGRISDNDGPAWITTTPAGYNFIHDLYIDAIEERDKGIPLASRHTRVLHWSSLANSFIKQSGLRSLQAQYDSRTYAQEVEGLFVRVAGLVYHTFSNLNIKPWKFNPKLMVHVGQDFNVGMMSSSFSQMPAPRSLHIFHERAQKDSDTEDLARYLDRFCGEHSIPKTQLTIYPDASGAGRNTAGKSDHKILRDAGYRIRAPKKNPFVKDRVNCVNGMLRPRSGVPHLFVAPECPVHIKDFRNQIWKEDSDPPEPDKEHGFDHMMDGVGYKVWRLFPLKMSASLGHGPIVSQKRAA